MTEYNQIYYLDLIGGIAGDMFIAAMLDCDERLATLVEESVYELVPPEVGQFKYFKSVNKGISGLRVILDMNPQYSQSVHLDHTDFKHLVARIKRSSLSESIKSISIELLTLLAKAEAKVHDKPLDEVHFHELADWDSLMDVVAIATILAHLGDSKWGISELPIGHGRVKTAHGLLPVPAPATMELLKGFGFIDDGEQGERITPTGALILRYLKDNELLMEPNAQEGRQRLQNIGYGLGEKVFSTLPNILRVSCFEVALNHIDTSRVSVIEFEVDDMTGEEIAFALDALREHAMVTDVSSVGVRGKKNRPMERIQILCNPEEKESVFEACFSYTSTIGLRWHDADRACLSREAYTSEAGRIKMVIRPGNERSTKFEYDDLGAVTSLNERRRVKFNAEFEQN